MQHPSTNLLTSNAASTSVKTTRRSLPPKRVRAETIEDAYVQFILYCNPGVPLEADTAVLREAFRIPPKSGGKTFSTYTLFELIRQFQNREIKTWAELALRLGVDPPDQDKGQSTQKIQQYAVRLKRWMHSMHVDAFFDYMLDNPHPYWTEIPSDLNPVVDEGRDGVAAEDDMALRSLLPHIRPRRGRKRPDDEDTSISPSQRPRMEGGSGDFGPGRPGGGGGTQPFDLWSAHSEGQPGLFPPHDQYARMNMNMGSLGATWTGENFVHTPLTSHPYSAITPSTAGQALWPEQSEEPRSAITPGKPKTNRRHGAKVVSSAWRSGAPGGSGKTRGRPPLNRQASNPTNDPSSPFSAFPSQSPGVGQHSPHVTPNMPNAMITHSPHVPAATITSVPHADIGLSQQQQEAHFGAAQQTDAQGRSLRSSRSRLSLHVPERAGGEVRLVTPPGQQQPPPVVMINGSAIAGGHQNPNMNTMMEAFGATSNPYVPFQQQQQQYQAAAPLVRGQYTSSFMDTQQTQQHPPQQQHQQQYQQQQTHRGIRFTNHDDRTNMNELESIFIYDLVGADWFDAAGNPIPPCSVEEALGISQQIIEDVMQGASTKETFLINVAALAGGSLLKSEKSVQVHKTVSGADSSTYECHWELQLGDLKGTYTIRVTLAHSKWRRRGKDARAAAGHEEEEDNEEEEEEEDAEGEEDEEGSSYKGPGGEAERWQRRYRELLNVMQQQKSELSDFRRGIIRLCQPRAGDPPDESMMGQ